MLVIILFLTYTIYHIPLTVQCDHPGRKKVIGNDNDIFSRNKQKLLTSSPCCHQQQYCLGLHSPGRSHEMIVVPEFKFSDSIYHYVIRVQHIAEVTYLGQGRKGISFIFTKRGGQF